MTNARQIQVVNDVLYGASADIVEYVRQRIPNAAFGFAPDAVGLGVVKQGQLLGGVVFDQYTGLNIVMSAAFESPRWATPKTLRQLFAYPFITAGCRRITAITTPENKAARAITKIGFQQEGILRNFFPGDVDGVVLGLLREECPYL